LPGEQQRRVDAADRIQLARRVLAMTVDGGGLDAEFARDLLGVQMRMDEAQAFALARGQQVHGCSHESTTSHNGARLTCPGCV